MGRLHVVLADGLGADGAARTDPSTAPRTIRQAQGSLPLWTVAALARGDERHLSLVGSRQRRREPARMSSGVIGSVKAYCAEPEGALGSCPMVSRSLSQT